ncbi:MAG: tetratricopeptide repeat protein, partial [Bacteroidota bacterium]
LGVALTNAGRPEEALESFTAAYTLNRHYGEPHQNVGLVLAERGRFDEAISYFRKALLADPDDRIIQADLERVQVLKKQIEQPAR